MRLSFVTKKSINNITEEIYEEFQSERILHQEKEESK